MDETNESVPAPDLTGWKQPAADRKFAQQLREARERDRLNQVRVADPEAYPPERGVIPAIGA